MTILYDNLDEIFFLSLHETNSLRHLMYLTMYPTIQRVSGKWTPSIYPQSVLRVARFREQETSSCIRTLVH